MVHPIAQLGVRVVVHPIAQLRGRLVVHPIAQLGGNISGASYCLIGSESVRYAMTFSLFGDSESIFMEV